MSNKQVIVPEHHIWNYKTTMAINPDVVAWLIDNDIKIDPPFEDVNGNLVLNFHSDEEMITFKLKWC
jgi:hypothetical protein